MTSAGCSTDRPTDAVPPGVGASSARPLVDPDNRRHLADWDLDQLSATMADVLGQEDDD
jgi:hypothetical protein